jgi:hypothetical protein
VKEFIRENWVWFAAPFIVAAVIVLALVFLGGEDSSPFIYPIH